MVRDFIATIHMQLELLDLQHLKLQLALNTFK